MCYNVKLIFMCIVEISTTIILPKIPHLGHEYGIKHCMYIYNKNIIYKKYLSELQNWPMTVVGAFAECLSGCASLFD